MNSARQDWRRLAAAEGVDPRVQPWFWDDGRLGARPGPAAELARRFVAAAGAAAPALEVLDDAEECRVAVSRTPLRAAPGHAAEQVSQLRLGQAFAAWAADGSGRWRFGAGTDGYPGWARAWHLEPGREPGAGLVLTARQAPALAAPRPAAAVLTDCSFGTRIAPAGQARAGLLPWRLPDGTEAWTPAAALETPAEIAADPVARVLAWGRRLLGVPYEWGGSSSWGLDCSGLVQLLWDAAGLVLPRDADLQAGRGEAVAVDEPEGWAPGDLLFFGAGNIDHVALVLGPQEVLHASGRVRIDPLDRESGLAGLVLRAARRPTPPSARG